MNNKRITKKRLLLYVFGLFFLSLGISFSIEANLGVSPVSSIAYAFALTTGFSVGMMTIVTHVLFIITQVMLSKRFDLRESIVQLVVAIIFGVFTDATLYLVRLLPTPELLVMRWAFLIISLFSVAFGLFGYMSAKLPLIPYDELTYVISEKFNLQFSKAKISSDLVSVFVAATICILFIHSLGSIGIGTFVAAYFVGKILGWFIKNFQEPLKQWLEANEEVRTTETKEKTTFQQENTNPSSYI